LHSQANDTTFTHLPTLWTRILSFAFDYRDDIDSLEADHSDLHSRRRLPFLTHSHPWC
jgi:hypothetical protein